MARTLEILEVELEKLARKQAIQEMDKRFGELHFFSGSGGTLEISFGNNYYSLPEFMETLFKNIVDDNRKKLIKRLLEECPGCVTADQ